MKKWIKGIAIVLVVLLVMLVVVANFFLGDLVKSGVEAAGPAALGVPMKLESAKFALLRGHISLRGFVLGNPEGFKTDEAISVGEITVDLDVKSLLSDVIVIRRIYVKEPHITYELGLGKSNIGRILEQAGGSAEEGKEAEPEPEEKKEEKPAAEETGGKKVVIDEILIEDGRVKLSATLAMGAAAPIPLPTIRLTDVGREEDGQKGASPVQVIRKVLGAIVGAVGKVVTGTVGLVGDGAKAVGDGAMAVGGAVGDGAKAVGGAVGDGAKAVGGAVADGAGKVVDGVTGIFKKDKPEEAAVTNETVPAAENGVEEAE